MTALALIRTVRAKDSSTKVAQQVLLESSAEKLEQMQRRSFETGTKLMSLLLRQWKGKIKRNILDWTSIEG